MAWPARCAPCILELCCARASFPHPSLLAVLLVMGLGGIAHVIGVCFLGFGADSAPLQQVTEYDELNRKLLAGGSTSLTGGAAGRRPSQPSLQ